jgi:hypothetical protein
MKRWQGPPKRRDTHLTQGCFTAPRPRSPWAESGSSSRACRSIYTTSTKKIAEHGGFSFGDTHVGLIVSRPKMSGQILKTPVVTSQVAPTILRTLGIDPDALKSVQIEQTPVLPGF